MRGALLLYPAALGNSGTPEMFNQLAQFTELTVGDPGKLGGLCTALCMLRLALLCWVYPSPFLAILTSQEQSPSNFNVHRHLLKS